MKQFAEAIDGNLIARFEGPDVGRSVTRFIGVGGLPFIAPALVEPIVYHVCVLLPKVKFGKFVDISEVIVLSSMRNAETEVNRCKHTA